jgi:hypothetical protein
MPKTIENEMYLGEGNICPHLIEVILIERMEFIGVVEVHANNLSIWEAAHSKGTDLDLFNKSSLLLVK